MIAEVEKLNMLPLAEILPMLLLLLLHMLSVGSDLIAVGVLTDWYCSCLAMVFGLCGMVLKAPPVG